MLLYVVGCSLGLLTLEIVVRMHCFSISQWSHCFWLQISHATFIIIIIILTAFIDVYCYHSILVCLILHNTVHGTFEQGCHGISIPHSVESPSMVDPQWHIWYWGSKWNLDTVCWSAVGCEWCTTSVYFGTTCVCFIPSRLPVFAVEPQYLLQDFSFLSKVSFEEHIQNLQKISCWFKIWMGFVRPILIKLWTSSIWGFL